MFFSEIARRWAKLSDEPPETMMSALVAGWWRGQMPNPEGREIRPAALEMLASLGEESKIQPFVEEQPDGGAVVNFWPEIILRAKPHELPAAELEEVYHVLAQVRWEDYPAGDARAGIACQQVSKMDFAIWYARSDLWPKPNLDKFWPSTSMDKEIGTGSSPPELTAPDPFQANYWSLSQVVAWIMCRRPEAVRQLFDGAETSYHAELLPRQTVEVSGTRNPAYYLASLPVRFGCEEARIIPREAAEHELKVRLEAAEVRAYGLLNSQGDLKEIPPLFWADARIAESGKRNMRPQLFAEPIAGVTFFTEVRCPRTDILTQGCSVLPA